MNSFVCPYHGWSYALDGSLRGVPSPESYGDCLDKSEFPLIRLRVEEYNGMIFASFNHDIEPLEDFLGAAKMDRLVYETRCGLSIKVLGEHRFTFRVTGKFSWKIPLMLIISR